MSAMTRLVALGSTDVDGVESHSSARAEFFGSIHKYISCGRVGGTYVAMTGGFSGFAHRSKKRMLKCCNDRGHAWMTRLHRKYITISRPCCGHTRNSRDVCPISVPVTNSVPNS